MRLRLKQVGGVVAASAALFAASGAVASPAAADDTRKNRVLVVMLDFKDRTHVGPAAVKADFAAKYFGAKNSLTSYYDRVSGGKVAYVPAVPEKVLGPFKLPMNAVPCNAREVRLKTLALLESKGIKRGEDYDSLSMATPRMGCSWAGLGTVGGPYTWLQAPNSFANLGVVVHEFGHNLGYPHQPGLACKDGRLTDCTRGSGGKSPMGGGLGTKVGLSATQLIHSGWLTSSEHQRVKSSDTFTLHPLYGKKSGLRALEVPLGEGKLVLEYRRPEAGLDEHLNGVYAYHVTKDNYAGARPLSVSTNDGGGAVTRITDTAHKVKVSVTKKTAAGATVEISVNGKPAPRDDADTAPYMELVAPAPQADAADLKDDAPITPESHEPPADGHEHGDDSAGIAGDSGDSGDSGAASDDGPHAMGGGTEDSVRLAETGGDATTTVLGSVGAALLLALGALLTLTGRRKRARR
ncbi:hypothetical protein [Streptomyces sp. NPDC048577]|uniref:hypothetical protein n=1 Tax=Streptomyces sp. NPDC048577 TaxID=3157209 RepID=UPI00342C7D87